MSTMCKYINPSKKKTKNSYIFACLRRWCCHHRRFYQRSCCCCSEKPYPQSCYQTYSRNCARESFKIWRIPQILLSIFYQWRPQGLSKPTSRYLPLLCLLCLFNMKKKIKNQKLNYKHCSKDLFFIFFQMLDHSTRHHNT